LHLQKSIADCITAKDPSVLAGITFESAVSSAEKQPELYAQAIWQALRTLDGTPNLSSASVLHPTHERCSLDYMLTPLGARCWKVLVKLGGRFTTRSGGSCPEGVLTKREFSFRSDSFSYCSENILGPSGVVDPQKVTNLLLPVMSPVVATSALTNNPKYSIDLSNYKQYSSRSSNRWFKRIVR